MHLRYRRAHRYGQQYPHVRYPAHAEVSAEQAEQMRQAMPEPDAFEVVEEGGESPCL